MTSPQDAYLLAGQTSELERLQLQSRVWEPAGRALLAQIPGGAGARVLDVGCGMLGWLRVLSDWVGPTGTVVGSDIEPRMLEGARAFATGQGLERVELVADDLFATRLAEHSFDLVHARFQIAPLGRAEQQMEIFRRLVRPGGWIVLEDPEMGSWRVNPSAPAAQGLIEWIEAGFLAAGGDFNSGRRLPGLMRAVGVEPMVDAHVVALPPGHPYLRLPLQFATSLRPRLEGLYGKPALDERMREAEAELARPETWGTTFTVVQCWGRTAG